MKRLVFLFSAIALALPTLSLADSVKSWHGNDYYEFNRFDDDNAGLACGFRLERAREFSESVKTFTIDRIWYPMLTREVNVKMTRQMPKRQLSEKPVFIGQLDDEVTVHVYLNRLTLEPEMMALVFRNSPEVKICR